VNEADRHGALADRRRAACDRSAPHVSRGEHAGKARLQEERRPPLFAPADADGLEMAVSFQRDHRRGPVNPDVVDVLDPIHEVSRHALAQIAAARDDVDAPGVSREGDDSLSGLSLVGTWLASAERRAYVII